MSRQLDQSRIQPPNSAIVAQYGAYNNVTGLIQVTSADGGQLLQRKITNQKFQAGQIIPASVQAGQLGFADGRSV